MFDSVLGFVSGNTGLIAGGGSAGVILWVFQRVPNDYICEILESIKTLKGKTLLV